MRVLPYFCRQLPLMMGRLRGGGRVAGCRHPVFKDILCVIFSQPSRTTPLVLARARIVEGSDWPTELPAA
jgi:hypothetical protein